MVMCDLTNPGANLRGVQAPGTTSTPSNTVHAGTHWAVGITALGSAITAVGIVFVGAGAIWTARQVREVQRGRYATAATEIASRWEKQELVEARQLVLGYESREKLCESDLKLKVTSDPEYFKMQRLLNFFEDLGVMEKLGGLSREWIELVMGRAVRDYWSTWEPTVMAMRPGQVTIYENFEGLAHKLASPPRQSRWRHGPGSPMP